MVSQDSKNSESSWDPTAGILYDGWNFSASRAGIKDSADIAALLDNVGMPKFILSDTLIRKEKAGLKINLLDYGQTLTLAQVALFLEKQGIRNYFLQIGKHTLAKGVNERQELWKFKTQRPDSLGKAKEGAGSPDWLSRQSWTPPNYCTRQNFESSSYSGAILTCSRMGRCHPDRLRTEGC
jgi:thiamine biosynthesis lipoprotein ApbE